MNGTPNARQLAAHRFMLRYQATHGRAPSAAELAAQLKMPTSSASLTIVTLAKKGLAQVTGQKGDGRRYVALDTAKTPA